MSSESNESIDEIKEVICAGTAQVSIYCVGDAWSVRPATSHHKAITVTAMLEIARSRQRFCLLVSPQGFHSRRDFFDSAGTALVAAARDYGVTRKDWKNPQYRTEN